MANFADLLTSKSKNVFDDMVDKIEYEKRKEIEDFENKEKSKYASRGFSSFESLIDYLKTTGRRVYVDDIDFGIYFQWDNKRQAIRHQVYENNDIDMTIGYTSLFYTEEDFIKKFENTCGRPRINEYGYLNNFFRNDKHPIEMYARDDIFVFNF